MTIDIFVILYCFDAIDRGAMTLIEGPGALQTAYADQCLKAIVGLRSEVGCGPRCHAPGNATTIKHDHLLALQRKLVGGRETRDTGADNHRVSADVLSQLRGVRHRNVHPE